MLGQRLMECLFAHVLIIWLPAELDSRQASIAVLCSLPERLQEVMGSNFAVFIGMIMR